jgi:hypothetical protein
MVDPLRCNGTGTAGPPYDHEQDIGWTYLIDQSRRDHHASGNHRLAGLRVATVGKAQPGCSCSKADNCGGQA